MKYNIPELLSDNGIDSTSEGHNSAEGWIQYKCPFCGDTSDHLGYSLDGSAFNCWRCGKHGLKETLKELLNTTESKIDFLLSQYRSRPALVSKREKNKRPTEIQLPSYSKKLTSLHRNYLWRREFDPDEIIKKYQVKGTANLGKYKFRIIIPIFHNGVLVSYIGRDITGKSKLRYKACTKENEVRPHKHCLYGLEHTMNDCVVIVEGITDMWRLGAGAVAQFGLIQSIEQLKLLKNFKRRFIFLDSGNNESKRAKELASALSIFKGENIIVDIDEGDPDSLSDKEAKDLMKTLVGRKRRL